MGHDMGSRTRQWRNVTSLDNTLLSPQHLRPFILLPQTVPPIDQAWFQEKLRNLKISQRQLAKRIGLDPAAVSYMFAGKRTMSMDEAKAIADIFLVPVTEVMRQAGIEVLDDVRKVPIAGYVGPHCAVTLLPLGTHDMVMAPADVPVGSFAVQMRDVANPKDGWLHFISGLQQPPEDCLDKWCIVAMADGQLVYAGIKRGYKQKLFNLILFCGSSNTVFENREVAWAARVLWIQPT